MRKDFDPAHTQRTVTIIVLQSQHVAAVILDWGQKTTRISNDNSTKAHPQRARALEHDPTPRVHTRRWQDPKHPSTTVPQ